MGNVIARIVLTGGPKGGKTTVLKEVQNLIEQKGYKVFVVAETATEVMTGGIAPAGAQKKGPLADYDFQRVILNLQFAKERVYEYAASKCAEDSVIIYDRGLMDNKGYTDLHVSHDAFDRLLLDLGKTEEEIMEHYDMILHLETFSRIEKPENVGEGNNPTRYENQQCALAVDEAIYNVWKKHKNFCFISATPDFEKKITIILDSITQLLEHQKIKKLILKDPQE